MADDTSDLDHIYAKDKSIKKAYLQKVAEVESRKGQKVYNLLQIRSSLMELDMERYYDRLYTHLRDGKKLVGITIPEPALLVARSDISDSLITLRIPVTVDQLEDHIEAFDPTFMM